MITHVQTKAIRNISFKISKLGSNTDQYGTLRQAFLATTCPYADFIPAFVIDCETPEAVRAYLSNLVPNDEKGSVYKRRQQFLEQEFAELIYRSERDALTSVEIDALFCFDYEDRATMDHILQLMRDCVETDPRRSLVLSRHAVLDSALSLLDFNGVSPDIKADVGELFDRVVSMRSHPIAKQTILFPPDKTFLTPVMSLAEYIDKQGRHYSWEEGNRKPDYPTVQAARYFCHAATFLCEVLWQWISEETD